MRCPNCNTVSVEEPFCPQCHINLESDIVRTIDKRMKYAWVPQVLVSTFGLYLVLRISAFPDNLGFDSSQILALFICAICGYFLAFGIYKKRLSCSIIVMVVLIALLLASNSFFGTKLVFLIVVGRGTYYLYKYHLAMKASVSKQFLTISRIQEGVVAGVVATIASLLLLSFQSSQLPIIIVHLFFCFLFGMFTFGVYKKIKNCAWLLLTLQTLYAIPAITMGLSPWVSLILIGYMIQGVRGTFGYHKSLTTNEVRA